MEGTLSTSFPEHEEDVGPLEPVRRRLWSCSRAGAPLEPGAAVAVPGTCRGLGHTLVGCLGLLPAVARPVEQWPKRSLLP